MKNLSLLCAFCLLATMANANEPPPVPEGGINYSIQGACEDHETGEKGYCYAGYGADGTFYLTFWQGETLMFIRQIRPGFSTYETVWMADTFATY